MVRVPPNGGPRVRKMPVALYAARRRAYREAMSAELTLGVDQADCAQLPARHQARLLPRILRRHLLTEGT